MQVPKRRMHPEIEIAGEATNGDEALALIAQTSPDFLLLDVQMPGMTGFDVLERLDDVPQVIFTTAYDAYAIKAFEVNALDYLMKLIPPGWRRRSPKFARVPGRGAWSECSCATATAAGSSRCQISSCWSPKAITRASTSMASVH
jgi:two-component system, LytTR family, response regulator